LPNKECKLKIKKMPKTTIKELLDAGVHFGHLKRKWNPNMAPFIFMERNGIHIIDLEKTIEKLDEAAAAIKQIAKSGRKILFVATKKQAKEIVTDRIKKINMPYVTERWPGGMLTNFPTIRKAVKKMAAIDKMASDGTFGNLSKREKLQVTRQRAKLEKNLGSIADLTRLPAAIFVVDISKEYIAVREANRLSIPVFAMVDTNSDPTKIDFPIPANDDASKSISLIINIIATAIHEGLEERKFEREKEIIERNKKPEKKELSEEELIKLSVEKEKIAVPPEQTEKQEDKKEKAKTTEEPVDKSSIEEKVAEAAKEEKKDKKVKRAEPQKVSKEKPVNKKEEKKEVSEKLTSKKTASKKIATKDEKPEKDKVLTKKASATKTNTANKKNSN
jgi:small subunit ribosomal protein S2